jgi:hypothetical protein
MDMLLNFIYAVNQKDKQYIPVKETNQGLSDYFGDRTLKGRVTDIAGENAIISFPGKNLAVRMLTPLDLGQLVTVRLKGNSPEQLTLQILSEKGENGFVQLLDRNPESVLKDLNMKQNLQTMSLIKNAMNYGLPLEKDFLQKASNIFIEAGGDTSKDMDIMAFMKLNNLPMSKEIFTLLKNFKENPLPLGERMDTLANNLKQLIEKHDGNSELRKTAENLIKLLDNIPLKTDTGKDEMACSLKNIVKNVYTPPEKHLSSLIKNTEESQAGKEFIGKHLSSKNMEESHAGKEPVEKHLSSIIKNMKENQTGKEFNVNNLKSNLQEIVLAKNFQLNVEELKKNLILELKELLNDLEIEDIKVVIKEKLGNNAGVDEIINYIKGDKHIDLKTLLKNNNLLDLKDMDGEIVEKLLSKKIDLKEFIKNLTYEDKNQVNLIHDTKSGEDKSKLSRAITSTLDHIDNLYMTMKNKSTSFGELPYISLPLPLIIQDQLKGGELRIYKKNPQGNKPLALKEIKIDLLLETLTMGPVEITVQSKGTLTDCKITVIEDEIKDLFEKNLDELKESLEKFNITSLSCATGDVDLSPAPLVPAVAKEKVIRTIDAKI